MALRESRILLLLPSEFFIVRIAWLILEVAYSP